MENHYTEPQSIDEYNNSKASAKYSIVGLLYRVSVIYTAVKPQSMSRESMDFKEIADENWDASQLVLHKCVCVCIMGLASGTSSQADSDTFPGGTIPSQLFKYAVCREMGKIFREAHT